VENYKQEVEKLPLTCGPGVFGLHSNAEIAYYTLFTEEMWRHLISLQPREASSGEGVSREDIIASTVQDIQSKVPLISIDIGSYDLLVIRKVLLERNKSKVITPCQVVLLQELERLNKLSIRMVSSLSDLAKALRGEIGMSDELDLIGDQLYNAFLPQNWRRFAPATQKGLGAWVLHFEMRLKQYQDWIGVGEPASIWLSGLLEPASYSTALIQTTCRHRKWALDKSTMFTTMTTYLNTEEVSLLESGSYVHGLFLEGAGWSRQRGCLVMQKPKQLVQQLPLLQVIPIEASKVKLQGTFRTPLYVTQARKNAMGVGLVFEADLASDDHPSLWVLQGAALVLNIKE
jgi:dynein heavy chain